jgi:hypothetical protein
MAKKEISTTEYIIKDFYGDKCLGDAVRDGVSRVSQKPQGFVEVYEVEKTGEKKLIGRHNLVLYQGREWLIQRMMNIDNPAVTSTKDEWINWFGLGDGGVLPADPIDPIPPVLTDTELYSNIMINASDSSSADYWNVVDADHPDIGYYKHPLDDVEFEQDALNDDNWLVAKITVTIGIDDANGNQLSEAGLFTASSDSGGYSIDGSGNFTLFARTTFPSIIKTSDRRLIFRWYLYV